MPHAEGPIPAQSRTWIDVAICADCEITYGSIAVVIRVRRRTQISHESMLAQWSLRPQCFFSQIPAVFGEAFTDGPIAKSVSSWPRTLPLTEVKNWNFRVDDDIPWSVPFGEVLMNTDGP